MKIVLPEKVKFIIETLETHGYEAYAVGGCVRDTMLHRTPGDWDITTQAKPEQVKEIFAEKNIHTIDTGIQHGTVTVMVEHEGFEVTTYRIDGEYEDARHPKNVQFTASLLEDLKRRDFTINAMAYNDKNGLIDAFDGVGDLERGVIRCVGCAMERFSEDALRMLRAVRFAAQLGFDIEAETKEAMVKLAPDIAKISAERIQTELVKLITSAHPGEIRTAWETGLTAVFLPEFDRMMATPQNTKHHCYSVGEHTLHTLLHVEPDKVLRLTMLLHDVAKPVCITTDEAGQNHFKGHPVKGADMAKVILRRLKFDNDTTDRVCRLVRYHDDRPELNARTVRRAMNRIGVENMPALFAVKRADTLGQSMYHRQEKLAYVDTFERFFREICAAQQCVQKKDLAISGSDLIAMGMKPGKEIGAVLNELFERVLDEPELNQRDKLLDMAHNLMTRLI